MSRRWWVTAVASLAVAASSVAATAAFTGADTTPPKAGNLGQKSGLLPRDRLTLESAIQVNLSQETVRLPLYPGTAHGEKVWYVLLDASDGGLAHDLGVNYAPKLANVAVRDPAPPLHAPRLAFGGQRLLLPQRAQVKVVLQLPLKLAAPDPDQLLELIVGHLPGPAAGQTLHQGTQSRGSRQPSPA